MKGYDRTYFTERFEEVKEEKESNVHLFVIGLLVLFVLLLILV